ncbi:MAG: DUF4332 domain-containing protein [Candidatus Binatia bacterium]
MALIGHLWLCLFAAFGLGIIAGWLWKQRSVILTKQGRPGSTESRRPSLATTERDIYTSQINTLQHQLEVITSALQTRDEAFQELQKELAEKVGIFSTLASQAESLQAQLRTTASILQQNTQSVQNLESEVHTLRVEEGEKERQLTHLLHQFGAISEQRKSDEAEDTTLNEVTVNLQNLTQEKDNEILELRAQIAELEPLQQQLAECAHTLQETEVHYQTSVREKDSEIIRLQAHIHALEQSKPQGTAYEATLSDTTSRHQAALREKDAAIARLQARLAGLELLLHRQGNPSRTAQLTQPSIHHSGPTSFGRELIPIRLHTIESDLADISDLDETSIAKLAAINITNRAELLARAASLEGRQRIAEQTGLSPDLVLQWVNRADLLRLNGMSRVYADLLHAAGVDSVSTLTRCTAETLHRQFLDINAARHLSRIIPILTQIRAWIQQARELPRAVFSDESAFSTASHPSESW